MAARFLHLIALLAVVLMPLGIAAPAAARVAPETRMHMAAGHCDEQSPSKHEDSDQLAKCAMACAMLLSEAATMPLRATVAAGAAGWSPAGSTAGARPEMDPPPPKLS